MTKSAPNAPVGHSEEGLLQCAGVPPVDSPDPPPGTCSDFDGGVVTVIGEMPRHEPGDPTDALPEGRVVPNLPEASDTSVRLWGEDMPQGDVDKLIAEENFTPKELLFVDAYLTHWNATQAAEDAGYGFKGSAGRSSITRMATAVRHRPRVKALIKARLEEHAMKANEVIARLGELARFDIGAFLMTTENPAFPVAIDWGKLLESGMTRSIRSLTPTAHGLRIDTQDPLKALALIGKHLGLFDPVGSPQAVRERLRSELDKLTDDELRTYVYNLATSTGVSGTGSMGDAQKAELKEAASATPVDGR